MRQFLSQSNGQNCLWRWKCPQWGHIPYCGLSLVFREFKDANWKRRMLIFHHLFTSNWWGSFSWPPKVGIDIWIVAASLDTHHSALEHWTASYFMIILKSQKHFTLGLEGSWLLKSKFLIVGKHGARPTSLDSRAWGPKGPRKFEWVKYLYGFVHGAKWNE